MDIIWYFVIFMWTTGIVGVGIILWRSRYDGDK